MTPTNVYPFIFVYVKYPQHKNSKIIIMNFLILPSPIYIRLQNCTARTLSHIPLEYIESLSPQYLALISVPEKFIDVAQHDEKVLQSSMCNKQISMFHNILHHLGLYLSYLYY